MKFASTCEVEFRLIIDPCPLECHPCNIIGTGDTFEAAAVAAVAKLDTSTTQRLGLHGYMFQNIHATHVRTLEIEQGDRDDVPIGTVFTSRLPGLLTREDRRNLFANAVSAVPEVARTLGFFRRRRRENLIRNRDKERAIAAEKAKPVLQRIAAKIMNLGKGKA